MPGLPHFEIPNLSDNSDGWGPTTVPEQFKNVPYAPFNMGEKLGRASDWTAQAYRFGANRNDRDRGGMNAAFSFTHNEEEDSFHLVDSRPAARPKYGVRRFQQNRFPNRAREEQNRREGGRDSGAGADRERQRRERMQQQRKGQWSSFFDNRNAPRIIYNSSVEIRAEWVVLEQIPFTSLSKLSYDAGEAEDIVTCGALEYYDKVCDRFTPKMEKPLERFENRQFHKVTTSDDPVIKRLSEEGAGTVFATDKILSTLMCAPRSVYSWDVVVHKVGGKLFFDQRDASFDLLTVNETAVQMEVAADDSINSVSSLSQEATFINQNFSQQVLQKNGPRHEFAEKNPFAADHEEVASVAYRYRKWKLDEETILVARCELDCVMETRGEKVFTTVHALNEFDPKVTGMEWRQKIENQRGAVLAAELRNNANKLAKWTAQALLAGAELMKLGYVSRAHPRDNYNHTVLTVQGYKPGEFASQITLGMNNMWGILKSLVDICMKLEDGKYLIVKDPNKPVIRLYEVPPDAFDNDYAEEPLAEDEQPATLPEAAEQPATEKDADEL